MKPTKREDKWDGLSSLGNDFYTILARVHYTGFWQEYYAIKFGCNDIPKDTIMKLFYKIAKYDKHGPVWSRKLDPDAQRIVETIFKSRAMSISD